MSAETTEATLPKGWRQLTLRDACELITDGSHFSPTTVESGIPYITVRDLGETGIDFLNCKFISRDSFLELARNGCQPNKDDVLFSKDGTVGKVALVADEREFVVLSSLAIVRPIKDVISSAFLKLSMQSPSFLETALGLKTGTALRRIILRNLKTVSMAVPPLQEQEKIVEILEEQLSRLDAALDSVRVVRVKAARFRRSLLHAAFNGALTGSDGLVGELPEGWTRIELGDVLHDAQPGFASGAHNSQGRGVVHMRPMNVSRAGNLDFSETKYVEDDSSRRLRRGDILFNNTNSAALVGKTAFVDTDQELAFSNHMTRLRPDTSRILANFLSSQLHAFWLDGFFEKICSNHVNQASVSTKRLKSVEVNFPPLQEQDIIVELLEEQLSRLDASLAVVDEIEIRSSALRRSLLHAAFTGELTKEWREGANV
jgi:type I restriction enzyme S subunit